MQAYEGVLPNVDFTACSRDQLKVAYPNRFFPCPEADCYDFKSSQQLRQELGPDQIAGLQQGTTAWHQARSRHITGSRIGDLLGFNLPRPNRVLVNYGVYHTVNDSRQGHQQLLSATAALRGGQATAAAAAELGAFGTLCCAWGCKHEAAALHTLLNYTPPGSCLFDSGFVTLNHDTLAQHPGLYHDIFNPTGGSPFGTPGHLDPQQVVDKLRLGCSLDGLLAVPSPAAAANSGPASFSESSIKRAPPYTWVKEAGYKACVVEVKCPAPFYPVSGRPWAFGVRGALSCQPYRCMKAHYYCQAQLNMLVTGTESCMFVVWTRTRTWLLHIPINKHWLHACLHLLMTLHSRYVAPQQQLKTPNFPANPANPLTAADGNHDSPASSSSSSSAPPCPAENLFWFDPNPALRALYRRFIVQTARLAAAMRSDVLPGPFNMPVQFGAAAAAVVPRDISPSAPPPGWFSGTWQQTASGVAACTCRQGLGRCSCGSGSNSDSSVQQAGNRDAASDAHWVADMSLGIHHCLVKSVNLPWSKQHPLQRDRWFLDRCDPDSPSQPDVCQGWVEHPLLEHVVTQPDAMVVLLQLLQEVQQLRPAAAAGVGSGGGLSPGPVILAMLLKLEQLAGLQLQSLWQQLPPDAQQSLVNMRRALACAAADCSLPRAPSSLCSRSRRPGYPGGVSMNLGASTAWPRQLRQQQSVFSFTSAGVGTCSLLGVDTPGQHCRFLNHAAGGISSLEALWLSRRRGWGSAAANSTVPAAAACDHPHQQLGPFCQQYGSLLAAGPSAARDPQVSNKRATAKRLVSSAHQRQRVVALNRYQQAVKQQPVRAMVEEAGQAMERVWLDQPLHVLLQQAIAESARLTSQTVAAVAAAADDPCLVDRSVLRRLLSRKRKWQQQQQQQDQSTGQQQQGCDMCGRTQSAPAVLHTGQFVIGGVGVSPRTGRKVFRRKFCTMRLGDTPATPPSTPPAKGSAGSVGDTAPADQSGPLGADAVAYDGHLTAGPHSVESMGSAVPDACIEVIQPGATAGIRAARQVAAAAARSAVAATQSRQPCLCSAASSAPPVVQAGATTLSMVTEALARTAIDGEGCSNSSWRASLAATAAAVRTGSVRQPQRGRRYCSCMLGRKRLSNRVQRPPGDGVASSVGQPGQQQQHFNPLPASSDVCITASGCPSATSLEPGRVVSCPCRQKPTLGWCNLCSVAEASGPLFSPGAVVAAAAVSRAWHKSNSSFQVLLRSRSKHACRRKQAVPSGSKQVVGECSLEHTPAPSAWHIGNAQVLAAQQEGIPYGVISPKQLCQQRDKSPEALTRQCSARSADAELNALIASGVFDELLDHSVGC